MENSEASSKSEIPKETNPNKPTLNPTWLQSNNDSPTNAGISTEQPVVLINPTKELLQISNDEPQKAFPVLVPNEASDPKMLTNKVLELTGPLFPITNSSDIATPIYVPRKGNPKTKSFVDISSLKTSLKRKLNLSMFKPNVGKQTFTQQEKIVEKMAQNFYVDPAAQNTSKSYLYPYKYTLKNKGSGILKTNQKMKKIHTIGSANKNNQRSSTSKKSSEINQNQKPMASTLSNKEIFKVPSIPSSKTKPLFFFPLKEIGEANSINLDTMSPESSTESKQTDEVTETVTATNNAKEEGDYFASFQTVKSSQASPVSAVANITQLTEISPTRLQDASENILESNTEIIQLINRLTEALKTQQNKDVAAGKISLDVSKSTLEEALLYALGKRPKTITIIRRATEPSGDFGKPTVYVQQLDVALKRALGNNAKVVSFVKKLIKTSVANYIKENPQTTKPGEINLDNTTSKESPVISVNNGDKIPNKEENLQKYPGIGSSKENEFIENQILSKGPVTKGPEYSSNSGNGIEENPNSSIGKGNVFQPVASCSKYGAAPEIQLPITNKNKIKISSVQVIRKPQLAITSVLQKIKNPPKEFYRNVSGPFRGTFGLNDKINFNSLNPDRFKVSPVKLPATMSAIKKDQKITFIKKTPNEYPIKQTIPNEENISPQETYTLDLANNQENPDIIKSQVSGKQLIEIIPESSKTQNEDTCGKPAFSNGFGDIPIKRFKLTYPPENLDVSFQNTASISEIPTPEDSKISNEMLEKKTEFASMQANIKSILESGIFKENMDNIYLNPKEISYKLKESELQVESSLEERHLQNFVEMHAALKSMIDSSEYQEMLIFANTSVSASEDSSNTINK